MKRNVMKIAIVSFLIIAILTIFLILHNLHFLKETLSQNFSFISPNQERFTELYFENSEHLPTKETPITNYLRVAYIFSFTIHNKEGKDISYPYQVKIGGADNEVLDSSSVFVKNNGTETITEKFYLPNSVTTKTELSVTLTQKKQEIDFWMGGMQ